MTALSSPSAEPRSSASMSARERVLDLGCGTGATTFEIGRQVSPGGSVRGVDVSRPMIEHARARSADAGTEDNVEFAVLDVEYDELPGPFDAAFSRLGVMFFDHPQAAFANVAASLTAHGRLAFVCFMSPGANPFITVPTAAALAVLNGPLNGPRMPPPGAAGPFSLADPDEVRRTLDSAGFESVDVAPGPDEVTLGRADTLDDLDDLARQALEQNPLVMSLLVGNPAAREAAVEAAAGALRDHLHDGEVRLGAGTWIVQAHARRA